MIIVVGRPLAIPVQGGGVAGLAGAIAIAAAARGARVELVGKLGDDPAGDGVLFALSRASVGHSAILRDPARPTPAVPAQPPAAPDDADDEWLADLDAGDASDARDAEADAAPGLDLAPADLELALRYLTDLTVLVLADPDSPSLVGVAADAAGFSGAALIIVGDPETLSAEGAPAEATILSAPASDPDGIFAALVAEYAVALDAGQPPAGAWAAATGRLGAERA